MKQQHEKKNLSTEAHFTLEYMHKTAAKSANVVIRNYKQKMKVTHFDGGDDFVNDNGEILNLHRFCWRKWSAGEKGLRLMLEKMMSMIKIEIL